MILPADVFLAFSRLCCNVFVARTAQQVPHVTVGVGSVNIFSQFGLQTLS